MVRNRQSLRQCDLAKRLGIDTATVANWEKGRTEPEARHLPKIIEFLGEDYRPREHNIWTKFRRFRIGLGLTQTEFATLVCVNETTVARWEKGMSVVPKKVLKMMNEDITFHAPKTKIGLNQLRALRTLWEDERI